jgi:hypothetical protein
VEHDRAIDHAGRLHDFLDKTITELKPMTVIQANQFTAEDRESWARPGQIVHVSADKLKKHDDIIASLTGIGALADRFIGRIAAAKVRAEAANTKVEQAFVKIDSAAVVLERVAEKAEAEADAAIARIGQVSNMEPE